MSSSFAGRTSCSRTAGKTAARDIGPGSYTSELLHHSGRRLTWQRPVSYPFRSKRDRFSATERPSSSVGPGSYNLLSDKVGEQWLRVCVYHCGRTLVASPVFYDRKGKT